MTTPALNVKRESSLQDELRWCAGQTLGYRTDEALRRAADLIDAQEAALADARHCLVSVIAQRKTWIFEIAATPGQAAEMERARKTAFAGRHQGDALLREAMDEMRDTIAPRDSFTKCVDKIDAFLTPNDGRN